MVSSYFNGSMIYTGISSVNTVILADCFRHYGVEAQVFDGGLIYEENAPVLDSHRGYAILGSTYEITTKHLILALYLKRGGEHLGSTPEWRVAGYVLKNYCLP